MKNHDIEALLRENKPQVKDNPTFLLEVQQKMNAVEGIKAEVDRQRRLGKRAIVIALIAGIIAGTAAVSLAYLYPVDPEMMYDGILAEVRLFIETYKQYMLLPIASCAIALGTIWNKSGLMFSRD